MDLLDRAKRLIKTGMFKPARVSELDAIANYRFGSLDLSPELHNFDVCRFVMDQDYKSLEWLIIRTPGYGIEYVSLEYVLECLPIETRTQLLFHLDLLAW